MLIDILFLITIVIGFATGYRRGLIRSVFALVAFFFGILIALKFTYIVSSYLQEQWSVQFDLLPFVVFIALLFGVIIAFKFLSIVIQKIAETLFLGFINRLIGGLLWCVVMMLLFSTVLWFLNQSNFISDELKSTSITYEFIISTAPVIFDFIAGAIPYFEGLFDSIDGLFDKVSNSKKGIVAMFP